MIAQSALTALSDFSVVNSFATANARAIKNQAWREEFERIFAGLTFTGTAFRKARGIWFFRDGFGLNEVLDGSNPLAEFLNPLAAYMREITGHELTEPEISGYEN